jgi:hypothetical protein
MSGSEIARILQKIRQEEESARRALSEKQLLDTYLSEKEESQRDEDEHDMKYWDSACQTIYDVAAALNIPLEVGFSKQQRI